MHYLVVCHPVIVEVAGCCETFPAGKTLMGFLSTVDSPNIVGQLKQILHFNKKFKHGWNIQVRERARWYFCVVKDFGEKPYSALLCSSQLGNFGVIKETLTP
jgi:hypothetical protein